MAPLMDSLPQPVGHGAVGVEEFFIVAVVGVLDNGPGKAKEVSLVRADEEQLNLS